MADGMGGPDFLSRSMFFREAEGQPTQQEVQGMSAPFQGSPEQAMAFLQSPGAQQMLQHFGLSGFDPSQIRQSPFLPNGLMQNHPMLGHALSNAMSNAAMTPAAPLVSGAGSGISRAMQGMMGGNEMQRQYQVRQLMAPFQAMGMQMPAMAEQRRQELLQSLQQDMLNRQNLNAEDEERRRLADQQKYINQTQRIEATRPFTDAAGHTQTYQGATPQQPAVQGVQQGLPGSLPTQGMIAPGLPAQGEGWRPADSQPSTQDVQAYNNAKNPQNKAKADLTEAMIGAGIPQAQAEWFMGRAAQANSRAEVEQALLAAGMPQAQVQQVLAKAYQETETGRAAGQRAGSQRDIQIQKITAQYDKTDQEISKELMAINGDKNLTEAQKKQYQADAQQRWQQNDQARRQALQNLGVNPGQKATGEAGVPKQVAPGASAGSGQAGGAGAQKSQGTAIQPPNPYNPPQQQQPLPPPTVPQNPY